MRQPTIAALQTIPLKEGHEPFLSRAAARKLIQVLRTAGTIKEAEAALEYANVLLEGHGVESVWDASGDRLVGLYVNMGDQYGLTLIADIPAERFYLTDWETWMLKRQKRYDIP